MNINSIIVAQKHVVAAFTIFLQCCWTCHAFNTYSTGSKVFGLSAFTKKSTRNARQNQNFHHKKAFSTSNAIHNMNIHVHQRSKRSPSSTTLFYDPIENESEEEKAERMNMVRKLQRMYYQDEKETSKPPEKDSFIMEDVPLWRTQWTELPGSQRVLNVHVPHYTNMFRKILSSDTKTKYFGHLYLPGGSENIDNPEYRLEENTKSTLIGTLMKITSYKELNDGRMLLVVQALEKFRVVGAKRHHSPYSIATIEIKPDKELVEAQERKSSSSDIDMDKFLNEEDANIALAVEEAFEWHDYEFLSVTNATVQKDQTSIAVSPLANYNIDFESSKRVSPPRNKDINYSVLALEHKVWLCLDEMIQLLRAFLDSGKEAKAKMPIPSQLLGLLPVNPIQPWPDNFLLEKHARKLEDEELFVGTFSKSRFVRVDNHCVDYPHIRRAQRLSFAIWTLTESILASGDEGSDAYQRILEVDMVEKRLDAAARKLQLICMVLKQNSG